MKIEIDASSQELLLREAERILKRYAVSTSKNGLGERNGSFCTPRGSHIVRARIGAGQPHNAVFVRRRPTGEVWTPELHARYPGRDWILTRILWLSGCEPGRNRLGEVDTMRRYIYIHGSPAAAYACATPISSSCSSGCRPTRRSKSGAEAFRGWARGPPLSRR